MADSGILRAETWIKQHEKLFLAVIAGLVLWFAIGKIDTLIQNHDNAALQQAKVVAQVQQEKNDALTKQVAQQAAQYQALATKLDAQNAQLVAANTQLATTLAKQQKIDATLPPTQLVARWNTLVPSANVTVSANGETLPSSGAVATVQALETIPVITQELDNTKTELKGEQDLLTASTGQVATLNSEVTGLNLQIVDNNKVCSEQIAVVKAAARKSKRKWFYAGIVVGWIGRQLVKTETGF